MLANSSCLRSVFDGDPSFAQGVRYYDNSTHEEDVLEGAETSIVSLMLPSLCMEFCPKTVTQPLSASVPTMSLWPLLAILPVLSVLPLAILRA